nr:MAG TPA: hypothetical protein [Crassvirales sp.]
MFAIISNITLAALSFILSPDPIHLIRELTSFSVVIRSSPTYYSNSVLLCSSLIPYFNIVFYAKSVVSSISPCLAAAN